MEKDLSTYDFKTLQQLYERELNALEKRLLSGASWAEVQDQRRQITAIGVHLYRKLNASSFNSHPAASNLRTNNPEG